MKKQSKSVLVVAILSAVAIGAYAAETQLRTLSDIPLYIHDDHSTEVLMEIQSDTGDYWLQVPVGMRIVDRRGNVVWEADTSSDDILKDYEQLLNFGIGFEDDGGDHWFTGKGFRKELLHHMRRILVGF